MGWEHNLMQGSLRGRVTALAQCSLLTLALLAAGAAQAQDAAPVPKAEPAKPADPDQAQPAPTNSTEIVVFGGTAITAALRSTQAEQTYNPDRASSYGVSSIGELVDAITGDNGDDQPQILINGQPASISDIADLPIEALARIDQLPRGSAVAIGGKPGERVYNVVLRPSVNTRTASVNYQAASAGGWDNLRADGQVTYIHGQDRINLSLRGGWSGSLLESERNVTPLISSIPVAAAGNVIGTSGGEIDPALSLLAGQLVTVAGVPVGSNPTLASFVPTAGQPNPSNLAQYRSLRGRSRPYEIGLSGNKVLAPWLALSFNGKLGWSADQRLSGLPSARFLLPVGHPNSPFSRSVVLAVNDPARPLQSNSTGTSVNMALTLNATFGEWRGTLAGKYDDRTRNYSYDTIGPITGGQITIPGTTNPFAAGLGGLIPIATTRTLSDNVTQDLQASVEGPLIMLPAGQLRMRAGLGATWLRLDGASSTGLGERHFRRHQYEAGGGLTIPLIGRPDGAYGGIGNADFSIDAAVSDLGVYGSIDSLALALNWQPAAWLRLTASQSREEIAGYPELLAAPTTTTPNVRYFDPVTGNTVDVTLISGGGGNLDNESRRVRRLAVTATPWKVYNLQLSSDFTITDVRNQAGPLPLPTPAIIAAFPDRFVRDSSGQLILVDSRTVNFARQHTSELRTAFSMTVPLAHTTPVPRVRGAKRKSPPRPVLQISASFTHVFVNTSTIREALGSVDLLAGSAVGLFGGRARDNAEASLALSDRGIGMRGQLAWHGPSYLATGTTAAPNRLSFAPYAKLDLKVFADLAQLFGPSAFTKGARITLSFDNLTNSRQTVSDQAGFTPLGYQAIYRDPLGRLISIELRKVF